MYHRILVPLDGSEVAETVLAFVVPLAERFASRVHLVTVFDESDVLRREGGVALLSDLIDPTFVLARAQAELGDYLARVARRLAERGFELDVRCLTGSPGPAIVQSAAAFEAELIAMTVHRRVNLRRRLAGDVVQFVLRTAPCPVLLVHVP